MNDKSDKSFDLMIKINQYFMNEQIISLKPVRGTSEINNFNCTEQMACSLPLILLSYN